MEIDIFEKLGIETNFGMLDWCIVIGYISIIVSIGVYIRKYIVNATDFIVAGRGLKTFLAIATMIGTEFGLTSVVYSAQKGFTGGFAAFHIGLTAAIATLIVGFSGFIVVPLRRMRVMTIPEFYEMRFSRGVRLLGGIILAGSGILNLGVVLKAGSSFVGGITGLTGELEIKIVMTVLLGMVLLYTTLGGMVSVVILDYIQFIIISVSLIAVTFYSIHLFDWNNIVQTVWELKGEAGFNPLHEGQFGLAYVIWMFELGLVGCAIWQTAVLRACSAESTRVVKKLYIFSSIGFLIRNIIPFFFGICALVYISQNPTMKAFFMPEGIEAESDVTMMALPIYLSQIIPAGFIGIICAGMLAAFMSSGDSYILCWSSVLTQDVVSPWFKNGLSSKTRLLLTRIFIVAIGIFLLLFSLWYPLEYQHLWDFMAISGALYFAGAIPILILGIYWKRASKTAAYLSLCAGLISAFGLPPLQKMLRQLVNSICTFSGLPFSWEKEVGAEYIGLLATGLALVLMIAGSLLFPDRKKNI